MKYIKQLTIILGISAVGEFLNYLLPLPIPASIYSLGLMLVLLCTGALKLSSVKEISALLLDAMPIMFIPAAAGIINYWDIIRPILLPCFLIIIVVTIIVMAVTGITTQSIIRRKERKRNA